MFHKCVVRWNYVSKYGQFSKQKYDLTSKVNKGDGRQNFCSNINLKRPDEGPVSLYNIKKLLKSGSNASEIQEGFTCIKTQCPVCEFDKPTKDCKKVPVFINKTTGNFICAKCQNITKWRVVEKFFQPDAKSVRNNKDMKKFQELFIEAKSPVVKAPLLSDNAMLVQEMSENAFKTMQNDLSLDLITQSSWKNVRCSYDSANKCLYFPITDVNSEVVAFKVLKRGKESQFEEEIYGGNSRFGIVLSKNLTGKARDSNSAILVLNIMDFLALGTQKINGKNFDLVKSRSTNHFEN